MFEFIGGCAIDAYNFFADIPKRATNKKKEKLKALSQRIIAKELETRKRVESIKQEKRRQLDIQTKLAEQRILKQNELEQEKIERFLKNKELDELLNMAYVYEDSAGPDSMITYKGKQYNILALLKKAENGNI